ncbi:GDP-mannose 4,6-dehydratase, partial [Actinophytocola sp.]|uniref:GDP-mannose 4,6-dehydratase n=1 Tax=Actinophytocola sp. TaxID=1872138 RepID=UPI002D8034BA
MRLLVSGGAGFIGSHYVRGVLEGRYGGPAATAVTVLDNLTYAGNLANLPVEHPRLCFLRGDISDARLLADVVP